MIQLQYRFQSVFFTMIIYWMSMKLRVLLWQRIGWIFIRSHWRCILTFQWWSLDSSVFIGSCWRWVLIFQWGRLGFLNKRLFIKLLGFIIFVKWTCIFVTLVHKTSHTGQSSESWIDLLFIDVWFLGTGQYLARYNYLKIWNLRVQTNY